MKLKIVVTCIFVSSFINIILGKEMEDSKFKPTATPYLKVQFWNVFSEGIHSENEISANRLASYFRRARFGLKGNLLPEISYDIMLSSDYLAKDDNLSTKGSASTAISVWSFYFTWKVNPENDWLNITGGYFLPHLSRESTTSPWYTSSLDKTEASCYLRQFVTGKTNGISPGINIGGFGKIGKQTAVYNIAYINRQDKTSIQTKNWFPVVLGHFMLNFGDSEFQKYKYTFSNNLLRKQTSATFGLGFSTQGKTDAFTYTSTFNADATIYLGSLKIDGEYSQLIRRNEYYYQANCVSVRTGYNIFLKNNWVLEPTAMVEMFSGNEASSDASFFDGKDKILDLGINLISAKRNVKVNLHYVFHEGEGTKNHYINNNSRPGNFAVLGIQYII
ncbi:MAG: hypothetical protein JXR61_07075 [Prolixibacteraceae bacterium]|nr:hypothetical protein [Prolixibacteraceae bacterium]